MQDPRGNIDDAKLEANWLMYKHFNDGFENAHDADGPRGDRDTTSLEAEQVMMAHFEVRPNNYELPSRELVGADNADTMVMELHQPQPQQAPPQDWYQQQEICLMPPGPPQDEVQALLGDMEQLQEMQELQELPWLPREDLEELQEMVQEVQE